jgi:hypothetical protein
MLEQLEKLVKTATFEYTDMTEVDSSLAQAVYYNADEQAMAVQFRNGGSVFYGNVPESFYRGFVTLDSIGGTYNSYVKKVFPNVSGGTVYDVTYTPDSGKIEDAPVEKSDELTYEVYGYIRVGGKFIAGSRKEAADKFAASLLEDGYELDEIAVTEVVLNIE